MNPNASLHISFTSCKSKHNLKSKYEHLALVLNSKEGRNKLLLSSAQASQVHLFRTFTERAINFYYPMSWSTHLITHDYVNNNCPFISLLIGLNLKQAGNSLFHNILKFRNVYK